MDERQLIAEIKDSIRSVRPSYFFSMNCVLYSRVEPGTEGRRSAYDEDVEAYMTELLLACTQPATADGTGPRLSRYDSEAFKRLRGCADARLKYVILRSRDDFLLVSVGIFDQAPDPRLKKFPPAEDASIGRGKEYYQFAYSYSQHLRREDTAVSEVLEKLSVGFEKYSKILSRLRGEFFDLGTQFADAEVYHLELTSDEDVRRAQLQERQDRFLETYAEWRRTGDETLKPSLRQQADEIRQLLPEFKFTV
jgi:hypothetical protein